MTNLISSGLYLLREREFIKSNETIYKIGRSDDVMKRVNQYPNGSMVYLIIGCNDNAIHESNLIEIFNNKFANEKYVGNEYFTGNVALMKETMIEYMKSKQNNFYIIDEELIIERVNKENNLCIPRVEQNIHNIKEIIKNIVSMEEEENADGRVNDKDLNTEDSVEENKVTNEVVQDIVIAGNNNGNGSNINANNSNITINITNNNITNTIDRISDRTCGHCGSVFGYPCLLERHIRGKRKCKPKILLNNQNTFFNNDEDEASNSNCDDNDEEIEDNVINNKKTFSCIHCNRTCASKYSLERHHNTCKVLQQNIINNNNISTLPSENQSNIPEVLISIINDYRNIINDYRNALIENKSNKH